MHGRQIKQKNKREKEAIRKEKITAAGHEPKEEYFYFVQNILCKTEFSGLCHPKNT